jgi:hypothetical protein
MNNRRGNLVKAEVPKEGLLPLIFIIIPLFIGSLGNKLTQYAGVDKLSKKVHTTTINKHSQLFSIYFTLLHQIYIPVYP